jgi:hypothetical protein
LVLPETLTIGASGLGVTDGVGVRLGRDVAEAVAVREGVPVPAAIGLEARVPPTVA